jgi:hypothetical protein
MFLEFVEVYRIDDIVFRVSSSLAIARVRTRRFSGREYLQGLPFSSARTRVLYP